MNQPTDNDERDTLAKLIDPAAFDDTANDPSWSYRRGKARDQADRALAAGFTRTPQRQDDAGGMVTEGMVEAAADAFLGYSSRDCNDGGRSVRGHIRQALSAAAAKAKPLMHDAQAAGDASSMKHKDTWTAADWRYQYENALASINNVVDQRETALKRAEKAEAERDEARDGWNNAAASAVGGRLDIVLASAEKAEAEAHQWHQAYMRAATRAENAETRLAAIDQHRRDSRAGSGSNVEDGGLWEDRALLAEAERDEAAGLFVEVATALGCNTRSTAEGNAHVIQRARYLSEQFTADRYTATLNAEKERDAARADARTLIAAIDTWRKDFDLTERDNRLVDALFSIPVQAYDGVRPFTQPSEALSAAAAKAKPERGGEAQPTDWAKLGLHMDCTEAPTTPAQGEGKL